MDPCVDFYQFACGGWIENNPMPEEHSQWDQFRVLRENLLYTIRGAIIAHPVFRHRFDITLPLFPEILEDPDTILTPKPLSQARSLYRTCLDQGAFSSMQKFLQYF
jgi:Peptidase family M13